MPVLSVCHGKCSFTWLFRIILLESSALSFFRFRPVFRFRAPRLFLLHEKKPRSAARAGHLRLGFQIRINRFDRGFPISFTFSVLRRIPTVQGWGVGCGEVRSCWGSWWST